MESIQIKNMYDLNETIAAEIFEGKTYPWEVLPLIKEFIVKLGNTLSPEEYDKIGEDIWVAKSAKIAPTVALNGPCIIGKDAEVRQCAFIRGSAIVGEGAVVGNSTDGFDLETGMKKFGAMLGDHVEIGCNSVLNPGTVIGRESNVYPLSSVRGVVPERSIFKKQGDVVAKR